MKVRNTLLLVAVLALIGAYVWFFERGPAAAPGTAEGAEPTPTEAVAVLSFDPAEARSLLLARPATGQSTLLRYDGATSSWFVAGETTQPADESSVRLLVSYLSDLSAQRVLTGTLDSLASYGLDPAETVVTVDLQDGQQAVVEIGAETLTGTALYVRVPGQSAVMTVSSYVGENVARFIDAPPYQPTPTPEPATSPEATPAPSPSP